MRSKWLAALLLGISILLMLSTALAQSDRGAIAGTVLDSSGAAVPGAAVTLKGVDTGSVFKTVSSSTGGYRISELAIGHYDVTVEATGFKASVQKNVEIQISTVSSLNVTLQPGNVTESVTVSADAPTIQTDSSDVGTVVGDKQIHDLPLSLGARDRASLRSPETFIFLTAWNHWAGNEQRPRVVGHLRVEDLRRPELWLGNSAGRRQRATFRLRSAFDQTAPSVEALTEFKVTTSTPSAQYGQTSGGVESFTTKSGTNRYHGTIFELFRNEASGCQLMAVQQQNAFNVAGGLAPTQKPRDRQNDFGGALGGPVRIPSLRWARQDLLLFRVGAISQQRGLSNEYDDGSHGGRTQW